MSDRSSASPDTPYDAVPYQSWPYRHTHPDQLATIARLFGMEPAPPQGCRVLELGCAQGGNLLAMAVGLPESEFVGIDASSVQVRAAEEARLAAGADNARFVHADILELDASWGPFDYVVCHGVYSWVPADVQKRILALCREVLAPQGVAYVSYNTLPGWYARLPMRDLALFHASGFDDPPSRIAQAKAVLRFLGDGVSGDDPVWATNARGFRDRLDDLWDAYFFHEYLETHNEPIYFQEFARRAWAEGLQYLGDAEFTTMMTAGVPEAVTADLERIGDDLLRTEQYLDYLRNRSFRKTLLTHRERSLQRAIGWEAVAPLYVTAAFRPLGEIDLAEGVEARFEDERNTPMSVDVAILKAAFARLHEEAPRAVAVEALARGARERLGPGGTPEADLETVATNLLACFTRGFVDLSVSPSRFVATVSERPLASAFARQQAEDAAVVTSRRHVSVSLTRFDRHLLRHLDGTRDVSALVDALLAIEPELGIEWESGRPSEPEVRTGVTATVEDRLRALAASALLVG